MFKAYKKKTAIKNARKNKNKTLPYNILSSFFGILIENSIV